MKTASRHSGAVPGSFRLLPLLLAAAPLLLGCAAKRIQPPTLQLERLQVKKLRLTGLGLEVGLAIRNPNPERVLIERFEYELELNTRRLGRGYFTEAIEIPALEERSVTATFDLNFLSLPGTVRAVLEEREVLAAIDGKFYVATGGSSPRAIGFKSQGRVPLER